MAIQILDLNRHICQQQGSIQSPHDPNVFIVLEYNQTPVICLANGTDRELSAQELANYLLEWESWRLQTAADRRAA